MRGKIKKTEWPLKNSRTTTAGGMKRKTSNDVQPVGRCWPDGQWEGRGLNSVSVHIQEHVRTVCIVTSNHYISFEAICEVLVLSFPDNKPLWDWSDHFSIYSFSARTVFWYKSTVLEKCILSVAEICLKKEKRTNKKHGQSVWHGFRGLGRCKKHPGTFGAFGPFQ